MAGSLINVSYQTDQNSFYALTRDESNSRATCQVGSTGTPVPLFLPAADPFEGGNPPQGFKERYVNAYLASDVRFKRRFPVGNPAAIAVLTATNARINAAVSGSSANAQTWVVSSYRGERAPRSKSFLGSDTGQDDGTTTQGL
jgi:hypothetical protein